VKPLAYADQLASMPQVVAALLRNTDAPALDPSRPLIFSGIGTSLHAARIAANWVAQLTEGRVRAHAVDAHDIGCGLYPLTPHDQLVVISHRGKKTYPNASLRHARGLGCSTVAIVGQGAPAQDADVTLRTCANETAGTFSVSYLASLTVLAQVVAKCFPVESSELQLGLSRLPDSIEASLSVEIGRHWVDGFSTGGPILISGFGWDLPTAQEAALKIKEGAWRWTEAMSPEFALHGTPASFEPNMSGIVMLPADNDGGRSRELLGLMKNLGMRTVATCGSVTESSDLAFAEPPHPLLRPLVSIVPFHLLTLALARKLDTDPDTLHGHRQPWQALMTSLTL
jgi:glutamine---fructose-6-phosphate transaminase (isomerizing)